jgi:hypothetical protein
VTVNPTRTLDWRRILAPSFVLAWMMASAAQLQILPEQRALVALAQESTRLELRVSNRSDRTQEAPLSTRLFQLSSATLMPAGDVRPWKKLTLLPHQTVVEHVQVAWPDVRAETRFEIRFFDQANERLGQIIVTVYPTNLLKQLASLARDKTIGLFDPANELAPLLRAFGMEVANLEEVGFTRFSGNLAIVAPIAADNPSTRELHEQVLALVKQGANVIWIVPRASTHPDLNVLWLDSGCRARVAVVPSEAVADLKHNAAAQLILIECARLMTAAHPLEHPSSP